MSESKENLTELVSTLKRQRDQLALKIHLGEAEAKQEWERVTKKLDNLMKEYEPLTDAVQESAGNVFDAMLLVAEEVKDGFNRIRKSL
jgi:hypothetical protein